MKAMNYKIEKVMRSVATVLICMVTMTGITFGAGKFSNANEANQNELTSQVIAWMENSAYWNDSDSQETAKPKAITSEVQLNNETEIAGQELVHQIETWMGNSNLWSDDSGDNDPELALQLKSWLGNRSFWKNSQKSREQHLVSDIKTWIGNSSFWTRSEEPVISGNELANN